ncbi:uncharacterized protein LOC134239095 [Saccostrea cucullata]|uniref:uncharacterized protein LOC134239095 n=1 Tax=Saccostrea cuccullata TaxID=36930 RepID=UPI002ED33224
MARLLITAFIFITLAESVRNIPVSTLYSVHPRCAKACSEMLMERYPSQNLCCFYARWENCVRTYTTCDRDEDMLLWIDEGCKMCKTTRVKWNKRRRSYSKSSKWTDLHNYTSGKHNKGLKF